jgi:HEAT repeat protein
MNGLQELYDRIAAGTAPPALADETAASLLGLAQAALDADDGDWEAALRVAAVVGGWRAVHLLREAVRTGPFERAALAVEWAPLARAESVLCQALECDEEALVLQALSLLTAHGVPAGTSRARRLLAQGTPAVRAAAADYLGRVAGPSVSLDLMPLLGEPDLAGVARLALDRLEGRAARPEPAPWPKLDMKAEILVEPAPIELPGELPGDVGALLELLGEAAPAQRPALVAALTAAPAALLAAALRPLVPGSPEVRAVGAGRYIQASGDGRWRLPARRLLDHPSPRARLAAAEALAAMGAAVDRSALERALGDPNLEVRAAMSAALARIAERER